MPELPQLRLLDLQRNRLKRIPWVELGVGFGLGLGVDGKKHKHKVLKVPKIQKLDLKKNWLGVGCARGCGSGETDSCAEGDAVRLQWLSVLDLRFNADLGAPG